MTEVVTLILVELLVYVVIFRWLRKGGWDLIGGNLMALGVWMIANIATILMAAWVLGISEV